jgi:hypothetical protein
LFQLISNNNISGLQLVDLFIVANVLEMIFLDLDFKRLTIYTTNVSQVDLILPSVFRLLKNVADLPANPGRSGIARVLQSGRT